MIKTVGDLLEALMERESAILGKQDVDHAPTIGAMYEGLTQDALRRSLPLTDNVSVVSGFARGSTGKKSRQLDCMIVVGSGEPIPHTPLHIYPVTQVVAVVEVKKTLYQQQFSDGFENLRSVLDLEPNGTLPLRRTVESAFHLITGQALPEDPKSIADPVLRQIYHQIVVEVLSPARVLLGYAGFKSPKTMRKAVVSHLSTLIGKTGGGPASMPDLIATPKASVIKANGMPFAAPMKDGVWPVLLSIATSTPAVALLEVLWTRLHIRVGGSPEWFGEDLDLEMLVRLVDYKYRPDVTAWEVSVYPDVKAKLLQSKPQAWAPIEINEVEHTLMMWLGKHEEIDLDSPPTGCDPEEVEAAVRRLSSEHLIGPRADRPRVFAYLTKQSAAVVMPDGRVVAGENVSGRLERWVQQETALLRRQ